MNNELLYPKNIEKLYYKIEYIIENDENEDKIENLTNWLNWFQSLNYKLDYKCRKDEFLKPYYENEKYSLQVWKHNKNVDSIVFNLISNYYSEYDTDVTKVII